MGAYMLSYCVLKGVVVHCCCATIIKLTLLHYAGFLVFDWQCEKENHCELEYKVQVVS